MSKDALESEGWVKASAGDTHNFDVQPILIGTYIEKQEHVGSNDSKMYTVRTDEGLVNFWGSSVIDTNMKDVQIGEMVRIEYKGKVKNPKTQREFKDFDIRHKPAPKAEDFPL